MKAWPACEIWLRFLVTTAMARSGILCVVWSSKTLPALRLSSANRRTVMPTPNPRSAKARSAPSSPVRIPGQAQRRVTGKRIQIRPGAGPFFRAHDRELGNLIQREHGAFQMAKCVTRDKRILNRANGGLCPDRRFLPLAKTRRPDRSGGPAARQRFRRRCRDGTDADLWDNPYGTAPDTEQEGIMHDHIGGTDMDASPVQMQHGLNLLFPRWRSARRPARRAGRALPFRRVSRILFVHLINSAQPSTFSS